MRHSAFLISLLFVTLSPGTSVARQEIYAEQKASAEIFKTPISHASFSLTAGLAAATSTDKTVKLLDLSTLKEKFILSGFTARVTDLAFSRSGQTLLTAGLDGQLAVWNTTTGKATKVFSPHSTSIVTVLMQDENLAFTVGGDRILKITDALSGQEIGSLPASPQEISSLALHPNGRFFAYGAATGEVVVYSIAQLAPMKSLTDSKSRISPLEFSPDGRYLAGGAVDGTVLVWETGTLALKMKFNSHKGAVAALAFDPKQRWLFSAAADSTLRIYDLVKSAVVKSMTDKEGVVVSAAFVNDETLLGGTTKGTIQRWRVLATPPDTLNPVVVILHPTPSSDGSPRKVFAREYEVQGIAFDDTEVKSVTVNGKIVALKPPAPDDAKRIPAGMHGGVFQMSVKLDSVGLNPVTVVATDGVGHSANAVAGVQRLSNEQALEVLAPAPNAETDRVAIPIQFKTWFDIASYSISVNLNELVSNNLPTFKSGTEVIEDEIPLLPGYNQVQLVVMSKSGDRFAKTLAINRKVSALPSGGPVASGPRKDRGQEPQRWAVVVGVSQYANGAIPTLTYADRDADAFASFLRRPEGGGYDANHLRLLLNKDATLANVRDALINFLNQAIDKDLVIIYFAGHGAPEPARPQNLYLLTYDSDPTSLGTTAFPMWDIQTVLARYINAKRVVVFTDACHSGGISVNFATRGLGGAEDNLINQYLADLSKSKEGTVVFTASAAGEVSQEFPEFGHGVFTYYLLDGMEGKADYNNDYTVTINELMQYVEDQVKRKTRGAQNPTRSQTSYDKDMTISIIPH